MEINKIHIGSLIVALVVIGLSFLIRESKFFSLIVGFGVLIAILPFIISLIVENKEQSEKEEMFIEFARSLVESVKTGTPISKSIVNLKGKDFGVLSPHVNKLANQISLGVPLSHSLQTFSGDVGNKTVSRALTLIGQAEKAGGDIGEILESVTGAVVVSDKLKKERKAAISTLVVQGYIIFLVFIIIILVMQFKILPMVANISELQTGGGELGMAGISQGGEDLEKLSVSNAFFYLLIVQGFFSGLAIGELAEGRFIAGLKHSLTLVIISFLVWQAAAAWVA